MLRWIGENFFKGMSIVSAVLLIFVGGMVVGTFQWGPAHLVVVAKGGCQHRLNAKRATALHRNRFVACGL